MHGPYRRTIDLAREDRLAVAGHLARTRRDLRRSYRALCAQRCLVFAAYVLAACCSGRRPAVVWAPIAAVATYAVVLAERSRGRVEDLELHVEELERSARSGEG